MQTKTQRLVVRGGIIVLAALLVSTVGGWAGGTTTDADRAPASGSELLGELRSLRDLLDRYPANMSLALLAYNRGPAKVEQLLGAGRNPANGYEAEVMKGFRHH